MNYEIEISSTARMKAHAINEYESVLESMICHFAPDTKTERLRVARTKYLKQFALDFVFLELSAHVEWPKACVACGTTSELQSEFNYSWFGRFKKVAGGENVTLPIQIQFCRSCYEELEDSSDLSVRNRFVLEHLAITTSDEPDIMSFFLDSKNVDQTMDRAVIFFIFKNDRYQQMFTELNEENPWSVKNCRIGVHLDPHRVLSVSGAYSKIIQSGEYESEDHHPWASLPCPKCFRSSLFEIPNSWEVTCPDCGYNFLLSNQHDSKYDGYGVSWILRHTKLRRYVLEQLPEVERERIKTKEKRLASLAKKAKEDEKESKRKEKESKRKEKEDFREALEDTMLDI
jgi:hypothetical protein